MDLSNRNKTFKLVLCLILLLYSGLVCTKKPNIVIFIADDMGYADAQSFGSPLSSTPNIDKLQREGLKLTQMYSAATLCSPARAGLLTGRYPVRSGIWSYGDQVVFTPLSVLGLPLDETTIPEMLAYQGYKSAIVGKWQLGVGINREYLPLKQGFDHYFGVPYSHEGCSSASCFPDAPCKINTEYDNGEYACPLILENDIIEQPVNLTTLAERMALAARTWIREFACDKTPFFLFYSSLHPHVPHFASKQHRHSTVGGEYTDSLAELDWELGEVLDELIKSNLLENTLVLFTSDNGPDRNQRELGGFSGPFRCGKFCTFDGGSRVPTIAYWPKKIKPGVSRQLFSHLDIWPTLRRISGTPPAALNITIDGFDITDELLTQSKSPRKSLLFYSISPTPDIGAYAVRDERYKAHFITENNIYTDYEDIDPMCRGGNNFTTHSPPLLYDVLLDPEEKFDIAYDSHVVCQSMAKLLYEDSSKVTFGPSVLNEISDTMMICCDEGCSPYPQCCSCRSLYPTYDLFPKKNCKSEVRRICKSRKDSKLILKRKDLLQ